MSETQTLSLSRLRGVGPKVEEKLGQLGIHSVQDLLFHLPLRYEDRTRIAPIGSLRAGDEVQITGTVELAQLKYGRRRSLLVSIHDGTGSLLLRLFHFSASQQRQFRRGQQLLCFGEVRHGPSSLEMVHPEYRLVDSPQPPTQDALTPVYPAGDGLNQPGLRRFTEQALSLGQTAFSQELLPAALPGQRQWPTLAEAIHYVHRPPSGADVNALLAGVHPSQQRLAFEELLAHHLSLRRFKRNHQQHQAPPLAARHSLCDALIAALPFTLTDAQQRVHREIDQDLARRCPMRRLLQGDVGSGKTIIAALAALRAAENGFQAALMAPTELLTEQHAETFTDWLQQLGVTVIKLTSRLSAADKRAALAQLASDEPCLAIGTHALFQNDVAFNRLGLIIIDEQHRFGVHQRMALRDKGSADQQQPHQLIMTATPIPRTLAMTAYADLDTSIIDQLPPGRTPVETVALPESRRDDIVTRIREACAGGRQAYWVCPLIDESDLLQAAAASETAATLRDLMPELHIELVHGRMKPAERDRVMQRFSSGACQLLVATTVIEVGVNVPNASLMIIENAERLGLAQLHQLRGRVGRGDVSSTCVLMYKPPLSKQARARVEVMRETTDGFRIAQRDLEIRGPGEFMGTRQTGLPQFRIADILRDRPLLDAVAEVADDIEARAPELVPALIRRWIGDRVQYRDS